MSGCHFNQGKKQLCLDSIIAILFAKFQTCAKKPVSNILASLLEHSINKRTCYANQQGENSSFTFTVCVKLVPRYHFKLAYVVL